MGINLANVAIRQEAACLDEGVTSMVSTPFVVLLVAIIFLALTVVALICRMLLQSMRQLFPDIEVSFHQQMGQVIASAFEDLRATREHYTLELKESRIAFTKSLEAERITFRLTLETFLHAQSSLFQQIRQQVQEDARQRDEQRAKEWEQRAADLTRTSE